MCVFNYIYVHVYIVCILFYMVFKKFRHCQHRSHLSVMLKTTFVCGSPRRDGAVVFGCFFRRGGEKGIDVVSGRKLE